MFQFIKSEINPSFGIRIEATLPTKSRSSQIIDTDFESDIYRMDNVHCLFIRLIIYEYSKRQLNVVANLKRYYQGLLVPIYNNHFTPISYKSALHRLSDDDYTLSHHYPHLDFHSYLPCLVRHLKRMGFAGLLK